MSGPQAGKLSGVLAPIATPFDPRTGAIDPGKLQFNIRRLLADGLIGIVVAGSTGEAPLLDAAEQRALVDAARVAVPTDRWLLVGTGAESTRAAVALTRDAHRAGADAVLVRPPGYFSNAVTPATLADYFRAVADDGGLPVFVYNIPKYTRVALGADLIAQLTAHERIVGVKDSSGDINVLASYRTAAPGWSALVGSGSLLYQALELGCDGGICGVACYAARACADLFAAFRKGDTAGARALQERIGPLDKEIVGKLGPAGIKAAMDAVGLSGGPVRAPLAPLSDADRKRVKELVG